jgi:hypothetical protein
MNERLRFFGKRESSLEIKKVPNTEPNYIKPNQARIPGDKTGLSIHPLGMRIL